MEERRRPLGATVNHATCTVCRRVSDHFWRGWLAYRVDDPDSDDGPELGFYCPDCAEREFGRTRRW
jgi:hypothetical protein